MAGPGGTLDVWETTYLHVLAGQDPVFDWFSGTGARPMLQALPGDARDGAAAARAVRRRAQGGPAVGVPRAGHGTVLPFRRVFVVAQK